MIAIARLAALSLALALAAAPSGNAAAAGQDERFADANAAYEAGDFQKAADTYRAIAEDGHLAPGLFYNLGNAEFRLGAQGRAALWYRRAAALDPAFAEADQNLRYLTDQQGVVRFEPGPAGKFGGLLPRSTWAVLLAAFGWTAAAALAARLLIRRSGALWGTAFGIAAAGGIVALGGWIANGLRPEIRDLAVVVAPADIQVRTAPADSAPSAIGLRPGSEVRQLDARGGWTYVETPGGTRGWIKADACEALWPWEPGLAG